MSKLNVADILKDLADNPDKVNELTDEQVEQVWKEQNPYKNSLAPEDDRIAALAYTNLSEDYQTKFLTTALVAFLYRRAKEFNIMPHKDDETKENVVAKKIIMRFLAGLFEYDPDKHVQECAHPPKTAKELDAAKKAMAMEMPDEKLPSSEFVTGSIEKKFLGSDSVPNDTFAWFRMYKNDNFDQIRWATLALYGVLPSLELMIQPCEIFNGKNPYEEYKIYEQYIKDSTDFSVSALTFGRWNILGPFQKNKDKVSFLNKNTEILQRILEQHKTDEAIGAELLKRRVKERKKENIRREGADDPELDNKLNDLPRDHLGAGKILTKEEKEKLAEELKTADPADDKLAAEVVEVLGNSLAPDAPAENPIRKAPTVDPKEYDNDYNPPDDAITVNVYTTDKQKGLQKSHFFTEAVAPDEEERAASERRDALIAEEKKTNTTKKEAEKEVKGKMAKRKGGMRK